jgi:hypothetical protein
MHVRAKWVCNEKEVFCHLLLILVVSIYIGVSLAGSDNSEAIKLRNKINMLDKAISDINTKIKASNTTLIETETKYKNYYQAYDSRCINLNEEFLKSHGF